MRKDMKFGILICAAAALAGCSGGMGLLDGKSNVPSANSVAVGNNLALPPDLQLATPGASNDAYQANGAVAQAAQPAASKPTKLAAKSAAATNSVYGDTAVASAQPATGDVFDQNGISKLNADGTKKTPNQLANELRQVLLAKKKQKNPSYGTIANIGSIFQDQ